MTATHDVRHLLIDKGYGLANDYGSRLQIEGAENGFAGYGWLVVPVGEEGRREHGGPLVAGPWADTFGLSSVIDNHGGTKAEVDSERTTNRCFTVAPGDQLRLTDTITVAVSLDARRYPVLSVV